MKTRTIQKQLLGSSEFVEDNTPIGNSFPITNPFAHINYSSKNQLTNQSINTKSLQEYSKKCDTVLFRCDWISVICPHDKLLKAPLFFVPNDTNSSEKLISVEGLQFYNTQSGEVLDLITGITIINTLSTNTEKYYMINIVYDGNTIPIFRFCFYSESSGKFRQNGYMSKIDIYGKAFRLFDISGGAFSILNFLIFLFSTGGNDDYIQYLDDYYFSRFDYKFDFFNPDKNDKGPKYENIMKKRRKSRSSCSQNKNDDGKKFKEDDFINDKNCPYGINLRNGDIYTGRHCGVRKNQYIYTRMYQKQVEIYTNKFFDLYRDYLNYKGQIWRLEFEFGSRFCTARGKISLLDELQNNRLSSMVFEYLGITTKTGFFNRPYFQVIKYEDKSALQRRRMYSGFRNIAKTYNDNSINPIAIMYMGYIEKYGEDRAKLEIQKNIDNLQNDIKKLSSVKQFERICPPEGFDIFNLSFEKIINDYSEEDLKKAIGCDDIGYIKELINNWSIYSVEQKLKVFRDFDLLYKEAGGFGSASGDNPKKLD